MKVKELREELAKYPDDMDAKIRIWKNGRVHSPDITIFQPEDREVGVIFPDGENPSILRIEISIPEAERELREKCKNES